MAPTFRSQFRLFCVFGIVVLAGQVALAAPASPPAIINYQGTLRDSLGQPLTGSYQMQFWIFDARPAARTSSATRVRR